MAVYKIPLTPNPQRFTINLGGTEYGVILRYRNFLERVTVIDIPQLANGCYQDYTESDLVAFSRNSVATYEDTNGKITRFDHGVPRITPSGLLVEAASTNNTRYSEDFSNASWVKLATGTGSLPVVTPNAATAPDGTITADAVFFDRGAGTGSGDNSSIRGALASTLPTGVAVVVSLWMRTADGTSQQVRFGFLNTLKFVTVTVTGQWQRFSLSATAEQNNVENAGIVRVSILGNVTAVQSLTLHLWGAQTELGATPSTYIPNESNGPATRQADIATIGHGEKINIQGGWVVDINDRFGAQLVNGIPLVTGCDLLSQYRHLGFSGQLRVQTDDTPDDVPTFANLGEKSHLYWITT
jgi:hypothetical protein